MAPPSFSGGTPCTRVSPSCRCSPPPRWPRPVTRTRSRSTTCWRWTASPIRSVSPDGSRVAFIVRDDRPRGQPRPHRPVARGARRREPRRLTTHPDADTSPRWSPDGRTLFFLSHARGSLAGVAHPDRRRRGAQVTNLPLDVDELRALARRPAPRRLARGVPRLRQRSPAPPSGTKQRAARKASGRSSTTRLFVRHWDTWERRPALPPVRPAGRRRATRSTSCGGMDADCPSKPFGGTEELAFTPDGAALVFTARDAGREEAWSTNFDLWRAPIDGSAAADEPDRREPGAGTRSPRSRRTARRSPTWRWRGRATRPIASAIVLRAWPGGPRPRADRGLGPLAGQHRLVRGRTHDPRRRADDLGQQVAVRDRRRAPARHARSSSEGTVRCGRDRRGARRVRARPPALARRALLGRRRRRRCAARSRELNDARVAAARIGAARAVHVHGRERRDGLRLRREAGRLRARPEVPGRVPDPRRPAGLVRRTTSTTAGIRRPTPAPATPR